MKPAPMLAHILNLPPVQYLSEHPFFASLTSIVGAGTVYIAQAFPSGTEGWGQAGGYGLVLVGGAAVIKWLLSDRDRLIDVIKESEKKQQDRELYHANRLDEVQRRLEAKWDKERIENLEHREKDRETRDKLADAVTGLADAVRK
jgi:hypothetical protein